MQSSTDTKKQKVGVSLQSLSLEEKNRLVGAFAWLIKQDKKQNPELYKLKKKKND
jgi:hypothetical protein